MRTQTLQFNNVLNYIYNLSLEDKIEIYSLLENNIAEERRNEIFANYKDSQKDLINKNLKFSSDINELKSML